MYKRQEYASLFGASTDTQASVNQNHSGYSGAGFVDKLEADGAGVTFYAKVANAGDYDVTFRYANGDAAEKSLSVYVNAVSYTHLLLLAGECGRFRFRDELGTDLDITWSDGAVHIEGDYRFPLTWEVLPVEEC